MNSLKIRKKTRHKPHTRVLPLAKKVSKRCLIIGIDSLIGKALSASLMTEPSEQNPVTKSLKWEILGTSRRQHMSEPINAAQTYPKLFLDLSEEKASQTLLENLYETGCWPDVIIFCAAMTDTKACEADPVRSHQVNTIAPVQLTEAFLRIATRHRLESPKLIFLSTSQVFDGHTPKVTCDAMHQPPTVYGKHKSEAENMLVRLHENLAIVRLSKVISSLNAMPLLNMWRDALREKKPIRVFSDRSIAPVLLDQVICLLRLIMMDDRSETASHYQLSGDEDIPYTALADAVVRQFALANGLKESDLLSQIQAVKSQTIDTLAYPGPYTTLNCDSSLKRHSFDLIKKNEWLNAIMKNV